MPDRWMEERERRWRERHRRNEAYGRGADDQRQGRPWQEERSFDEDRGHVGSRYEGPDHDRVFGERDTGAEYNRPKLRTGGAYRSGGYGGESYGRAGSRDWRDDARPEWQDRDYSGVSPAMENDEYELERSRGPRFQSQDYTRGGRYYGDDQRQSIYRAEYGQGGTEYGRVPRGYDAGGGYRDNRELEARYVRDMGRPASGGTGGYDFERGYGDAGRSEDRGGWHDRDRDMDRGRQGGGDFFHKVSSWIGSAVGEVRRDLSGERGQERSPQRYSADFNREARWEPDRGHRGRGPKDYRRSDERISDEVHQRLTDDPWLDASNISCSVSGGEVTLSGTVENREAKHRAERCVEEISGVNHVQNNLRVEAGGFLTSAGRGYGDSAVEAQMKGDGGATKSSGDSAATRTTTRRT